MAHPGTGGARPTVAVTIVADVGDFARSPPAPQAIIDLAWKAQLRRHKTCKRPT